MTNIRYGARSWGRIWGQSCGRSWGRSWCPSWAQSPHVMKCLELISRLKFWMGSHWLTDKCRYRVGYRAAITKHIKFDQKILNTNMVDRVESNIAVQFRFPVGGDPRRPRARKCWMLLLPVSMSSWWMGGTQSVSPSPSTSRSRFSFSPSMSSSTRTTVSPTHTTKFGWEYPGDHPFALVRPKQPGHQLTLREVFLLCFFSDVKLGRGREVVFFIGNFTPATSFLLWLFIFVQTGFGFDTLPLNDLIVTQH